MGADGGIVLIPLKPKPKLSLPQIHKYLAPFWQFLSNSGLSSWADDANSEWFEKYEHDYFNFKDYLVGNYGTDRGDNVDIYDELYPFLEECLDLPPDFTFELYNLEYITEPWRSYSHPAIHKVWSQHFYMHQKETIDEFHKRVLSEFGEFADVKMSDWAKDILDSLDFKGKEIHETWT